jgi:hypothetical protein
MRLTFLICVSPMANSCLGAGSLGNRSRHGFLLMIHRSCRDYSCSSHDFSSVGRDQELAAESPIGGRPVIAPFVILPTPFRFQPKRRLMQCAPAKTARECRFPLPLRLNRRLRVAVTKWRKQLQIVTLSSRRNSATKPREQRWVTSPHFCPRQRSKEPSDSVAGL